MPSLDTITIDGVDYKLKAPNSITFTGAATGSYDGSSAVTVNIPNADLSNYYTKSEADEAEEALLEVLSNPANGLLVKKSGERGYLAGYEGVLSSNTVKETSYDVAAADGAVTVENGVEGHAWTKVVLLEAASPTVTFGSRWAWRDGEAPTIKQHDFLVCAWVYNRGIASIVSGSAS